MSFNYTKNQSMENCMNTYMNQPINLQQNPYMNQYIITHKNEYVNMNLNQSWCNELEQVDENKHSNTRVFRQKNLGQQNDKHQYKTKKQKQSSFRDMTLI